MKERENKVADNVAQWLKDNPDENLEVTLRFDRKAIDEMNPKTDFFDSIITPEMKAIFSHVRIGVRKYLEEKTNEQ